MEALRIIAVIIIIGILINMFIFPIIPISFVKQISVLLLSGIVLGLSSEQIKKNDKKLKT